MNAKRQSIGGVGTGMAVLLSLSVVPAFGLVRNDGGSGSPVSYSAAVAVTTPLGLCSGTVVGDGWYVLTAKHCTSDGDTGTGYSIANFANQTDTGNTLANVMRHPTYDIALIPLATQFGSFVDLYSGAVNMSDVLTFTGVGASATVPGSGTYDLGGGTFRQGQNNVESLSGSSVGFYWNNPGLGGAESLSAPGDSGMGYLVSINGTNYLVGVHSGRIGSPNTYGSQSVGTVVAMGNNSGNYFWILDGGTSVPEPGTLGMVVIGLGGIFFVRRQLRVNRPAAYAVTGSRR